MNIDRSKWPSTWRETTSAHREEVAMRVASARDAAPEDSFEQYLLALLLEHVLEEVE